MEETTNTTPETTATQPDAAAPLTQEGDKGVSASPRIHDIPVKKINEYAELFDGNGALSFLKYHVSSNSHESPRWWEFWKPKKENTHSHKHQISYIDVELEKNRDLAFRAARTANGLFWLASGILILNIGYDIWKNPDYGEPSKWLPHILPRIIFIILLQIFSYFYFSLTKTNLNRVQYLINEKTNIELKLHALKVSMALNQTEVVNTILLELSKTERNFIIDKDKTTIEMEKLKHELDYLKNTSNIFEQIGSFFEKIKIK